MTYFSYINTNIERIRKEIRLGIISISVLTHYRIYSRYDYYKLLGNPTCLSIQLTAKDLKISEIWVKKIKRQMEQEI